MTPADLARQNRRTAKRTKQRAAVRRKCAVCRKMLPPPPMKKGRPRTMHDDCRAFIEGRKRTAESKERTAIHRERTEARESSGSRLPCPWHSEGHRTRGEVLDCQTVAQRRNAATQDVAGWGR